jgi:hypothetical protein
MCDFMWTYTAYILKGFAEKGYSELKFNELSEFVFEDMYKKAGLIFHDDRESLFNDLRFLDKEGGVRLMAGRKREDAVVVLNKECLVKISDYIARTSRLAIPDFYDSYTGKIDIFLEKHISQQNQK